MSEPWFDPNAYAYIPGTLLGVAGGVVGPMVGLLAPRGRARGLVVGVLGLMLAASAALLVAGLIALATGQPYGVWYGLGLPGVIGLFVFGLNLPGILRVYRHIELRKLEAQDVSL